MDKNYLVEGARLRCKHGKEVCNLKVAINHGVNAEGKKKANVMDYLPEINIPGFGECELNILGRVCKGYMKIESAWKNLKESPVEMEILDAGAAITMDSFLVCSKGGLIIPETSGQGMARKINWDAFKERYAAQLFWYGVPLNCIFDFDPINLNTGNFVYDKKDLEIEGVTKLSFHIFYNSMDETENRSLGMGWHHNYDIFLEKTSNMMLHIHLGDGRVISCRHRIGDLYLPTQPDNGLLKREKSGYRYVTKEIEYIFDSQGVLQYRKDNNGNTDSFFYNDKGQLSEVKGANGGQLYYFYNGEERLYRVCDHTGREIRIWYAYGMLRQFVNSRGKIYTYNYNENFCLESVVTPRGIEGVKNIYDSANRVVKQLTPDGGIAELNYDDNEKMTYAKGQNGCIVSYESDSKFRNIRTTYEDGEECFEYNDYNQKTLYVDKNGNKTRFRYDGKGNLIGVCNALGEEIRYSYDENGNLLKISMGGKAKQQYQYDEMGRLVRVTDAVGRSTRVIYSEKGFPEKIILADGSHVGMIYDEKGNIESVIDPYDNAVQYEYDGLNRVSAVTDAEGNRTVYQYNESNHVTSVIMPDGSVRNYTYNESGLLTQIKDYDGGIFTIIYNAMGKPEKLIDKEGRESKRNYDLAGNLKEEISALGAVISYHYDRYNRPIKIELLPSLYEEKAVQVVEYTYDPVGNLLKIEAGDGEKILSETIFEYDALNRIIAVREPAGGKVLYHYDRMSGKVDSITDAAGNQYTYRYNEAGELTEVKDIGGNITYYEYNKLGQVTLIRDEFGGETKHFYQPGGRLIKSTYPQGRQLVYEYDSMGRVVRKTDGQGYSVTYKYDCMGRTVSIQSSEGQEKLYSYDAMGNVISMVDANGNRTTYAYTWNGRLKEVTDALGNKTQFTYDAADRVVCVCRKGKIGETDRITSYERNVFGQIECIRDALGGKEFYRYDALGRVISKTDKEGFVTEYTYAADGKKESILYGDGNKVEFQYTLLRQLSVIKDWLGEIRIVRSMDGKPIRVTDHEGRTIEYQWGKMGERKKMIYPDGTTVKWNYDSLNRLIELVREKDNKATVKINYLYDGEGRINEKISSGGYHTKWTYNGLGLPEEMVHEDSIGILDRYCYSYDSMGNRTMIKKERRGLAEENGVYRYCYDELQRLVSVNKNGRKIRSYHYDSFGNRIGMEDYEKEVKSSSVFDVLDRLIKTEYSISGVCMQKSYTYDKRGNMTGEYQDGELILKYAFGAMNRLDRTWNRESGEAIYTYNGLGHRVGTVNVNGKEKYLLDITKPYHNLLGISNGDKRQNFYWGLGIEATEKNGISPQYYLQDELGSPLRVLYDNGEGNVYGYDEFGGELQGENGENDAIGRYCRQGAKQPFGYTGYCYDSIGCTYFAQAREYKPEIGRFLSEDIVGGNGSMPKTLNRYWYCWGNPVNVVDWDGKEGYYFYSDNFEQNNSRNHVESDIRKLEEYYDYEFEVTAICVKNENEFIEQWNAMDDTYGIDFVIVYAHADEWAFYFTDPTENKQHYLNIGRLGELDDKDINYFISLGCNTGGTKVSKDAQKEYCMAESLLQEMSGINYVIATDRRTFHSMKQGNHFIDAKSYSEFWKEPINWYNRIVLKKGFKLFDREQEIFLGGRYLGVAELLKDAIEKTPKKMNKE